MGMSSMLRIVGSSIGPALAAMFMQTNQSIINVKGISESLPSYFSFDLVFLTGCNTFNCINTNIYNIEKTNEDCYREYMIIVYYPYFLDLEVDIKITFYLFLNKIVDIDIHISIS